ncbi:hypothetical protein ACFX5K_00320 [Rickettsiales bacterium LUAb2]
MLMSIMNFFGSSITDLSVSDVFIIILFVLALILTVICSVIMVSMRIKKINVELEKNKNIQIVNEKIIQNRLDLILNRLNINKPSNNNFILNNDDFGKLANNTIKQQVNQSNQESNAVNASGEVNIATEDLTTQEQVVKENKLNEESTVIAITETTPQVISENNNTVVDTNVSNEIPKIEDIKSENNKEEQIINIIDEAFKDEPKVASNNLPMVKPNTSIVIANTQDTPSLINSKVATTTIAPQVESTFSSETITAIENLKDSKPEDQEVRQTADNKKVTVSYAENKDELNKETIIKINEEFSEEVAPSEEQVERKQSRNKRNNYYNTLRETEEDDTNLEETITSKSKKSAVLERKSDKNSYKSYLNNKLASKEENYDYDSDSDNDDYAYTSNKYQNQQADNVNKYSNKYNITSNYQHLLDKYKISKESLNKYVNNNSKTIAQNEDNNLGVENSEIPNYKGQSYLNNSNRNNNYQYNASNNYRAQQSSFYNQMHGSSAPNFSNIKEKIMYENSYYNNYLNRRMNNSDLNNSQVIDSDNYTKFYSGNNQQQAQPMYQAGTVSNPTLSRPSNFGGNYNQPYNANNVSSNFSSNNVNTGLPNYNNVNQRQLPSYQQPRSFIPNHGVANNASILPTNNSQDQQSSGFTPNNTFNRNRSNNPNVNNANNFSNFQRPTNINASYNNINARAASTFSNNSPFGTTVGSNNPFNNISNAAPTAPVIENVPAANQVKSSFFSRPLANTNTSKLSTVTTNTAAASPVKFMSATEKAKISSTSANNTRGTTPTASIDTRNTNAAQSSTTRTQTNNNTRNSSNRFADRVAALSKK